MRLCICLRKAVFSAKALGSNVFSLAIATQELPPHQEEQCQPQQRQHVGFFLKRVAATGMGAC